MTTESTPGWMIWVEETPNICQGNFDAVSVLRGEIFIFRGRFLWRLTNRFHILPGYPVNVAQIFSPHEFNTTNSPTQIDAAYQRSSDGHIVLFSGKSPSTSALAPKRKPTEPENPKPFQLFSPGNQYWLHNGSHFVDGSPRLLTDYGIDSQVASIDAALVWGKNSLRKHSFVKREISLTHHERQDNITPLRKKL